MSLNISRTMLEALLPKGKAWTPKIEAGMDLLFDGVAENWEFIREILAELAFIRDPDLTTYLEDMEREYGLLPILTIEGEADRRPRLKNAITDNQGYGTTWDMQAKLRAAGFDSLFVYQNDPPVDINDFLGLANITCRTGFTATCGGLNNTCGGGGGELIVNGDIFYFQASVTYPVPPQIYWHNVFFIGGQATFGDVTHPFPTCGSYEATCGNPEATCGNEATRSEIVTIPQASVSIIRRDELRRLIMKYKPIHSWCALIVTYI